MIHTSAVRNYIRGEWCVSDSSEHLRFTNPATGEELGQVPLSTRKELYDAIEAASSAFVEWRCVPVGTRIQYLFQLKKLLEENFEDISKTVTMECGKTLAEARGEMRRA